jgi:hypothetical protein
MTDETRVYNCGGPLVELTLPDDEFPVRYKESLGFVYLLGLDLHYNDEITIQNRIG